MISAKSLNNFKALGLWAAVVSGSIFSSILLGAGGGESVSDGPLTAPQAFLVVSVLYALVLTVVASNSRLTGMKLAALIFVTFFGIQSFMMQIETLYFIENIKIPMDVLAYGVGASFITSLCAAGAGALLWRSPQSNGSISISQLPLRITVISLVYVGVYFLAGYSIAWRSDVLRAYYAYGIDIELWPFLVFQAFRGGLWTLLALVISQNLSGSIRQRALIVGFAFSVLATAQLAYPNIYMPWDVRKHHLIELGLSNFVFGVIAVFALFSYPDKSKSLVP